MNGKLTFLLTLMVPALVAGCAGSGEAREATAATAAPAAEAAPDPIDQAHQGSSSSRTWTVFSTEGEGHLEIGHAFRLQQAGGKVQFVPLTRLRRDWQLGPEFAADLASTQGAVKKLCGVVTIPGHDATVRGQHGPQHLVLISPVGPNLVDVSFFRKTDDQPVHVQCENPVIHGGTAHAEN